VPQDLKSLAKSMRERAKSLETLASDIAVAGVDAMLNEMLDVTPVDESTALSNWQVNLGVPAADELPAAVLGRYGSTRGASADKTLAEGRAELQYKKPGQPIFLSNLVPYIGDLDDGSSRQFPGGFVPRALIVFRLAVQDAKKRLLR
jgi:hypothetical protein